MLSMLRPCHSPGLFLRKTVFELESIHLKAVRNVCPSLAVVDLGLHRISVGRSQWDVGSALPIAVRCVSFITLGLFRAGLPLPIAVGSASPIAVGDHLYFMSENGIGTVLKASRTFTKIATNLLEERALASYAVVENSLLIRTAGHLYRIGR